MLAIIVIFLRILSLTSGLICQDYFCSGPVDVSGLGECMNSSQLLTNPNDTKQYALLVSESREPHSYEHLSLLINGLYAQANNYSFTYLLQSESIVKLHKTDWQWNKVSAAMTLLYHQRRKHGYMGNVEYLMVMDVDVLILDFTLNLTTIIQGHPLTDIILFSDTKDGVNAGFLIIKNTQWALGVLYKWWELRRKVPNAQDALCMIYDMYREQIRQEERLLHQARIKGKDIEYVLNPHQMIILPYVGLLGMYPTYGGSAKPLHPPILHLRGLQKEVKDEVIRSVADQLCQLGSSQIYQKEVIPPPASPSPTPTWPPCSTNRLYVHPRHVLHSQRSTTLHTARHTLQLLHDTIHRVRQLLIQPEKNMAKPLPLGSLSQLVEDALVATRQFCDIRQAYDLLQERIHEYHSGDLACQSDVSLTEGEGEWKVNIYGDDKKTSSTENALISSLQVDCYELLEHLHRVAIEASDAWAMTRYPNHDVENRREAHEVLNYQEDGNITSIRYVSAKCRYEIFMGLAAARGEADIRALGKEVRDRGSFIIAVVIIIA